MGLFSNKLLGGEEPSVTGGQAVIGVTVQNRPNQICFTSANNRVVKVSAASQASTKSSKTQVKVTSRNNTVKASGGARVVKVSSEGIQGPPGASGGFLFVHTQSSASATWTINHNLGSFPSVELMTLGGVEMDGAIQHTSPNQTVITFNTPQTGIARFN